MKPKFSPGKNIAMKVPSLEYDRTIAFYRDVLGFDLLDEPSSPETESVVFKFGDKNLWIDRIPGISQAELWLEVVTDDIVAASTYLEATDCVRRDEIEPLPDNFRGFWIANPANIIHLVSQ